jgi:putative nucleotidyltransferase with HDIG domain
MRDWFQKSWKKYYTVTYRILAFIIAIGFITYLLPKTGKFRYEYIKGKPWKHTILIAPFDFPIYKNTNELNLEKDSLLNHFRPYFVYDTSAVGARISLFNNTFNQSISNYQKQYPSLFRKNNTHPQIFEILRTNIANNLRSCYTTGIITLPDAYIDASPTFELSLIKGSIVEPYGLSELLSQQAAYQTIMINSLNSIESVDSKIFADAQRFLSHLQLNRYISPNVLFDPDRTQLERDNLLKNISLTSGKVLSGQRIIGTGEIVDAQSEKVLDSLKKEYETRLGTNTAYYLILLAQAIIITLLFIIIYLFLYYFRKDVFFNLLSISFILMMIVLMIGLTGIIKTFSELPLLIIPFTILPIIIRTFFDSRLAFFLFVMTVIMSAFFAGNGFQFMFLQIPAGMVAIFSLFRMVRRGQLVRAALMIFLTYSLFYTGISLWQEGDIEKINPYMYGQFAINAALILLAYPLIDIFERMFGFLSDVTLVELSDTNHPILRKLAEKAPGTFQHSIQVGNLAQEVAYKIGGNPMLVRAGAMYHDIGKMVSPLFFTENQASGLNPHAEMELEESARLVISHIENGVKLARKEKVPEQIIDFIRTHQGTTQTKFFYNSYINKHPDVVPDISAFTYPGPTPFTKETAILMMADSIEAASRSLKNYSDNDIDKLVEQIINTQVKEGQFINAPITFKEITEAKEVLKLRLKNIYHARIEYPKIKSNKDKK